MILGCQRGGIEQDFLSFDKSPERVTGYSAVRLGFQDDVAADFGRIIADRTARKFVASGVFGYPGVAVVDRFDGELNECGFLGNEGCGGGDERQEEDNQMSHVEQCWLKIETAMHSSEPSYNVWQLSPSYLNTANISSAAYGTKLMVALTPLYTICPDHRSGVGVEFGWNAGSSMVNF